MPFAPRAHLAPLYYADGRPADDYQVSWIIFQWSSVLNDWVLFKQLEGSLNGVVVDDGAESKLGGGLVAGALANMQPLFTVTSVSQSFDYDSAWFSLDRQRFLFEI